MVLAIVLRRELLNPFCSLSKSQYEKRFAVKGFALDVFTFKNLSLSFDFLIHKMLVIKIPTSRCFSLIIRSHKLIFDA